MCSYEIIDAQGGVRVIRAVSEAVAASDYLTELRATLRSQKRYSWKLEQSLLPLTVSHYDDCECLGKKFKADVDELF